MNMQKLMQEAKKMQAQLEREQEELGKTIYEGNSSLVNIKINGKKEIVKVTISKDEDILKDDIEMLEDMVMVAFNDANKKADEDKNSKFSKYGNGLSGLM